MACAERFAARSRSVPAQFHIVRNVCSRPPETACMLAGRLAMRAYMCLLAIAGLLIACAAEAQPRRIVSLDYCADQYVLGLADRSQIAALSPDADADFSSLASEAAGLAQVRPQAEEVLSQRPDLVVRSWGGDARALALFERLGIEVHQIGFVADFDDVRRETRSAAAAFGRERRSEALLAQMDAMLAGAEPSANITALYVTPGGVTAGQGTFIHALFTASGLSNAAGDRTGWTSLPLEEIVTQTPGILVTGFADSATDRVDRWSASRHPVMRRALGARPSFALDTGVIACTTWLAGAEVARLSDFARANMSAFPAGDRP